MKFLTKTKIPWKEGAVLIVERLGKKEEEALAALQKKNETPEKVALFERLETILRGWEGIDGDDGKPLPFNDDTRRQIARYAFQEDSVLDKLAVFLKGPLGNLSAGLTASSKTSGTQDSADNASEKKEAPPANEGKGADTSSTKKKG